MKKILIAAVFGLVSSALFAAPYHVTHSTVKWQGGKQLILKDIHNGKISLTSGSFDIDGKTLKSGQFVINMKTITNDDIKNPKYSNKLVKHLSSDDFFAVEKYPTSTFKFSTTTIKPGSKVTMLNGELTLKGTTKKLSIPAMITWKDGVMTGKAKFKIDRSKWNVKYGSTSFFKSLGDKAILNDIDFDIALMASPANKKTAKATKK